MTEFLLLLDEIFKLFSYENQNKKIPDEGFFPTFEAHKSINFTSGWVKYPARSETRDHRVVTTL